MIKSRKLWTLEKCAIKAEQLSLLFALSSSRLGDPLGKNHAIIADELKSMSNVINDVVESTSFSNEENADKKLLKEIYLITDRFENLALNCAITAIKTDASVDKDTMILADEARKNVIELKSIISEEYPDDYCFEIPTVIKKSPVTHKSFYFLSFIIGGLNFAENAEFIQEVLFYNGCINNNLIKDGILELRGNKLKVVNLYEKLGLKMPEDTLKMKLIIMRAFIGDKPVLIAVMVDKVNVDAIFMSPLGVNSAVNSEFIPDEVVRECWDTNIKKQIVFLDWKELI